MTTPFDKTMIPEQVPVMNLSQSTLFPKAILPLYIFENRYKLMLEEVLNSHRLFAVTDLESETESENSEAASNKNQDEAKKLIAGIGVVRACRKNPDGTAHLILQGMARVQLLSVSWDRPYPLANIEYMPSENTQGTNDYKAIKPTLIDSIESLLQLDPNLPEDILPFLANLDDSENVLDVAIASLCPTGKLKQNLLETISIKQRYEIFLEFLKSEREKLIFHKKLLGDLDENDTKNN
jgi:Lon protease-like protein